MKTCDLLDENLKLLLKDDVLLLTSGAEMTVVSSAVYNGGLKKAKFLLNMHVPEKYDQKLLHENPELIIIDKIKELKLSLEQSVGMVTAAETKNFSLMSKDAGNLRVNAIVTAGCSFAETAGEPIEASLIPLGTINTIVVIHGRPTESCLLQAFITATEAKTASLRELDVRSKYSGDLATGTITDSLIIASTDKGSNVSFGGPASKLGKLVGYCTKEAVKNALIKQSRLHLGRSIFKRFAERNIPINDFLTEISQASFLKINEEEIKLKLFEEIEKKPLFALILMMASNIDEDIKKGLIPKEFKDIGKLGKEFKENILKITCEQDHQPNLITKEKINFNVSPFLKNALVCLTEGIFYKNQLKRT